MSLRYGRAHLADPRAAKTPNVEDKKSIPGVLAQAYSVDSWRPARVVDDLLGYRAEVEYLTYLAARYVRLVNPEGTLPTSLDELSGLVAGLSAGIEVTAYPALVRAAVKQAEGGILAPELAPHLSRVQRLPRGIVDVPDMTSFVAWCLEVVLRDGPVTVTTCASCGKPWLQDRGAEFCDRPAPRTLVSCRALDAQRRYVADHGDFHRQRRRLYDRTKRGTLGESVYREWLEANRPGALGKTWVRFEDWQKGKRPKGGKKHG